MLSPVAILEDRSLRGRVAWVRYVDYGALALATVKLSAAATSSSSAHAEKKSAPVPPSSGKAAPVASPPRKVYEHQYLGAFGVWVPLPYLPRPGLKPETAGIGLCLLSRCVCVKRPTSRRQRHAPKTKVSEKEQPTGSRCLTFQSGKSAALNVMVIPNGLLFFLWQWPGFWARLAAHTTFSLANLQRGRLWVLFTAPFSHRGWSEIFRTGVLLTTTLDSFYRGGVCFPVFLSLYLGGSWAAWACTSAWRRMMQRDQNAYYAQEMGASGGLAAQLLFLAGARPEDRFQFSFYFIPVPVQLSAWQSLLAHGAVDVLLARGGGKLPAGLCSQLASWVFGWAVYRAWVKYG